MQKRTPLKDAKQSIITTGKNTIQAFKQTCKPTKPTQLPVKKEITPTVIAKPSNQISNVLVKPKLEVKQSKNTVQQKPIRPSTQANRSRTPTFVPPQVKQDLYPCKDCGRTFVQTALKHHEKICKKVFLNKRKEFNSAKQRIASKEQLNLLKKNKGKDEPKSSNKPQIMPLWKQQSLAFRTAMKAMKGGSKTEQEVKFLQNQNKIMKSSMFKCKHCGRSFNEEAGKRHEGFCAQKAKDMSNKMKRK